MLNKKQVAFSASQHCDVALHMVKFNNEKKNNNGNSYVGFGIFKIKPGEWQWRCTSASGFFNFFLWLNQLKNNFIFWNTGVVIFICTLRLGLILEPLKYSENPLESTGESSCPWEIFKYRDLDFFLCESVQISLIYGIQTPNCHGPSWRAVGQHLHYNRTSCTFL